MNLEYENGRMRIENAEGLRWELTDAEKPRFSFDYDALHVTRERAMYRAGTRVRPLAEPEIEQVHAFIEQLSPPTWASLHKQMVADLRAIAQGLINTVVTQLEYNGLLDVMITGRDDSGDLYAEEARRVLCYVDSVWNAFHGLAVQIEHTPKEELKHVKEYADMLPFPPPLKHFSGDDVHKALFDGARGQD